MPHGRRQATSSRIKPVTRLMAHRIGGSGRTEWGQGAGQAEGSDGGRARERAPPRRRRFRRRQALRRYLLPRSPVKYIAHPNRLCKVPGCLFTR